MTDRSEPQPDDPDVVTDVYLTTSLELLERPAGGLGENGQHAALRDLVATVCRHTASIREHLHGLGAYELGSRAHQLAERADALERRERELLAAEAALVEERATPDPRRQEAEAQAHGIVAAAREHSESAEPTHLIFVPAPDGYHMLEREGRCPDTGATVALGERAFEVAKVVRSPLPGDRRRCAYVY